MNFQNTGYTIKQVQQQIHTQMEDVLRPLDLNISQYNVLKNLEATEFVTGAELARKAFITPQTMHTMLMTMERKELVLRSPVEGNKKVMGVAITSRGVAVLGDAEEALSGVYKKANSALSSDEHAKLEHLLHKLSAGLYS